MKTTKVLETNITETNINEVSKLLNFSSNNRVAICNANTLVRSVKDLNIRNLINNFTIKTPDGFPVAKALTFLTKKKFSRVDGYKVFLQTISDGLDTNRRHYFFGNNENTTQKMINKLEKMFPKMDLLDSNHGSLVFRRAYKHGIPKAYIKKYNDFLQVGKGWKWHDDLTIDTPLGKVYFCHGKTADVLKLAQSMGMSCVQGHYHSSMGVRYYDPEHMTYP